MAAAQNCVSSRMVKVSRGVEDSNGCGEAIAMGTFPDRPKCPGLPISPYLYIPTYRSVLVPVPFCGLSRRAAGELTAVTVRDGVGSKMKRDNASALVAKCDRERKLILKRRGTSGCSRHERGQEVVSSLPGEGYPCSLLLLWLLCLSESSSKTNGNCDPLGTVVGSWFDP